MGVYVNSKVRKVTYKNCDYLKSTWHHVFPKEREVRKRLQKNVNLAKDRRKTSDIRLEPFFCDVCDLLRTSRSFAVFSFDLRLYVKYLSVSTGPMDNDCFFETKNNALSIVNEH